MSLNKQKISLRAKNSFIFTSIWEVTELVKIFFFHKKTKMFYGRLEWSGEWDQNTNIKPFGEPFVTIPWGRFLPCWHLYVGYVCYIYYTRMTCYAWKLWPDNNNASTNISVPWKYFQISIISLGLRYSITKFISTGLTNSFTSYYNSWGRPIENLV